MLIDQQHLNHKSVPIHLAFLVAMRCACVFLVAVVSVQSSLGKRVRTSASMPESSQQLHKAYNVTNVDDHPRDKEGKGGRKVDVTTKEQCKGKQQQLRCADFWQACMFLSRPQYCLFHEMFLKLIAFILKRIQYNISASMKKHKHEIERLCN